MCDYRIILSLLLVVLASPSAHAEVVVLRNGGVLEGTVVESNQSYIVSLGGRAETSLTRSSVRFICGSMREAYEIQREQNAPDDTDAHIELARWCVRHNLFDEARAELAAIPELRQADIRIGVIERKIELQLESIQSRQANESAADTRNSAVSQATHIGTQQTDARDLEIGRLLDNVSTNSIARFNRDVQTRLLHGCAASGCHSADSENSFQLHCESPYRVVPRKMMFQNFANCYQLIDQTNRDESRLLKYLLTPHGDQKMPVYRAGSKHYEAIRQWVLTAGVTDDGNASFATRFGNDTAVNQSGDKVAGWKDVTKRTDAEGVDPFDPDVFNRRYGVDRAEPLSADDEGPTVELVEGGSPDMRPAVPQPDEPVNAPRRLSNEQTANAKPAIQPTAESGTR